MTDKPTLQCSPLIKNIEEKLGIAGRLTLGGYSSVFDILNVSRAAFVRDNTSALGAKSAEVYDIAAGLANQVRRGFRKTKLSTNIQTSLQSTSTGQQSLSAGYGVPAFIKTGPTWQNQFDDDWSRYCKTGAPEAYDSPVSYLSWLYNQARTFEKDMMGAGSRVVTLAQRRPDLPQLLIDDEAINKTVPSLTLVNDILKSAVAPYVATLTPTTSVDQTLSTTRYPTMLPYHYPHDQAVLSLSNTGQSLSDIISQTDKSWPYFIASNLKGDKSEAAWEIGSELAPEQQKIATEADNSKGDLTSFYTTNLGTATDTFLTFADIGVLTRQTGITGSQLEDMVASTSLGASLVVASPNVDGVTASSAEYGAAFINQGMGGNTVYLLNAVGSPADTLSTEEETGPDPIRLSTLNPSSPNAAKFGTGLYGHGLSLYNYDEGYAYFDPEGEAVKALSGDRSFTIGFWFKFSSFPTVISDILLSSTDRNNTKPGFSILLNGLSGTTPLTLLVNDSTGKSSKKNTASMMKPGTWFYIALCWDATKKIATLWACEQNNSTH